MNEQDLVLRGWKHIGGRWELNNKGAIWISASLVKHMPGDAAITLTKHDENGDWGGFVSYTGYSQAHDYCVDLDRHKTLEAAAAQGVSYAMALAC